MKKFSLVILGLAMVASVSLEANALELKAPSIPTVKNPVASASTKTDKSAANENYQKEYQAKIEAQQKALNAVKAYDKEARLELAKAVLPAEKVAEIKGLSDADTYSVEEKVEVKETVKVVEDIDKFKPTTDIIIIYFLKNFQILLVWFFAIMLATNRIFYIYRNLFTN